MAVALGGIFGNVYGQYSQLANARFWNTKSYDYPLVVNKGEVNQNALNEFNGTLNKTSLFAATNKTGYVNQMNGYVSDDNQIYQIRNVDGSVNNSYYVDQETGNVYLRPPTLTRQASTQTQGPTNITNPAASPTYNVTLTAGADSINGVQNYNWGATINPGNRVNISGEYTVDGINWTTIPGTVRTLDSSTGGSGSINFTIPPETLQIRWLGQVNTDPAGTQQFTYNHTYQYPALAAGVNNSNMSGVFDLSDPSGGISTATLSMKYVWNLPSGTPTNSSVSGFVEYSTNGGTIWNTLAGSNFNLTGPGNFSTPPDPVITVNLPNGHPAMTANTRFRVVSNVTTASPTTAVESLGPDTHSLAVPVNGTTLSPNPSTYYSTPVSYDLSNAISPTTLNFSSAWNITEGGQANVVVEYSNNGSTGWTVVPNTTGTVTASGTHTATANFADLSGVGAIGDGTAFFRVRGTVTQGASIPVPSADLDYFTDNTADADPEGNEIRVNGFLASLESQINTQLSTSPAPSDISVFVTLDTPGSPSTIKGRLEYTTDGVNWNGVAGATYNATPPIGGFNDWPILNATIPAASLPANPTFFKLRWANYYDFVGGFTSKIMDPLTGTFGVNTAQNLTGVGYTGYYDSNITNTSGATRYGRYEYWNGFAWIPTNNFTLPNGATTAASGSIGTVGAGSQVRITLFSDAGYTTAYGGAGVSVANQTLRYGKNNYSDLKVALGQNYPNRPADLPQQVPSQTTTSISKTYNTPPQAPVFSPTTNNLQVIKNVVFNPGTAPTYQSGNFTLTGNYDAYNSITLPVGVTSNPNEAQYFGSSFYLDEVPKPEEFGQGAANNIKVKAANPALFTTFPAGSTAADYSRADYLELIVNGVSISVGNLDTSIKPAIVPNTDPQSSLYRFSTDFTGGDLDFSVAKGSWAIDTTTGFPTSGQYVTDARGYAERYHETVFNKLPLDNFVVSTDIYAEDVDPAPNPNPVGNATNFAGIRIRASAPGDAIEQSGYLIAYENGQVKVLKGDDAVASFSTNVPSFGTGDKVNLKVHANGNDIQIYVDDTFVGQYIDPYYSYNSGYTSFVTSGRKVGYDNVLISSYASPIQLLSQALKKGENSIVVKTFGSKNTIVDVSGTIGGVDLATSNIPPDLLALNGGVTPDINSYLYKHASIPGLQGGELDKTKGYWSSSIQSSLGVAGKITFKNKEGSAIYKTKEEFSKVNAMMSNLTSVLGLMEDTFNSHLNIIR